MGRYAIFNGLVYGGGTEVIPNPEGTPTEELHSVQIGEDIYEIVGGGGSGEGYSETLLYETTTPFQTGVITLNDNISNYDVLLFRTKFSDETRADLLLQVSLLQDVGYVASPSTSTKHALLLGFSSYYFRVVKGSETDDNIINIFAASGDQFIYEIYGIKIEGGSGSGGNASLDATVLYDTPITATGTYSLTDDYNNYDFIGFKAGNGSTETDIRLYAVKDIQDSMNNNLVITNNVTNSWFNFTINENELTIPGKTVSTIYSVIGYKIKGGGGNSNVEANPAGTPTDTLSTIGIDGTIYNIEGSSGGGSSFVMDELYIGTSEVPSSGSTVSLSKSIDNYDFIMFDIGQNTEHTHQFFTPDNLNDSTNECILFSVNGYCDVYASTSTELTFGSRESFSRRQLYGVYGLKFGSGGSGSQELISYDTTITTTQYGWWTAEDKDGNTLDPNQYELIAVTPFVNNSPSWVGSWDGAFFINTNDGTTYRYDVTFVNINDGGYIRTSRTWNVKVIYRDKNAAGGGGGSTVVPNPQEEPTDTLNTIEIDGTVYNIEGGSEGGQGVEIYSEDEYIVGKWIDGKKLYQKTFYYTHNDVIGDGYTTIASLSDADYFEFVECSLYNPTDKRSYALSYAYGSKTTALTYDNGDIKLRINNDTWNANWNVVVTVRYTKTVETPAPAWGGSVTNNYANFIDTSNIIDSGVYNPTTPLSYTATEDCFMVIVLIASNNPCIVSIDNKEIYRLYDNGVGSITVPVPIKKGQTITATTSYTSEDSPYTVYGITYASGGSESGSSKVEYSTEEKEVGTWIDGSKIYQKTFVLSSFTSGTITINASDLNIKTLVDANGEADFIQNGEIVESLKFPHYISGQANSTIRMAFGNIQILHTGLNEYTSGYVTVRYTKTTT